MAGAGAGAVAGAGTAAESGRRKQDDRNLEALRSLILAGGNRHCLDCGTRGPTYVNTTLGSFVCSKCSGMLRGLTPPHRVKSISMATFTPEEMELIRSRGNDYCRRIWLGLYEGESADAKDEQSIRDFMIDKYERKRYYLEPDGSVTNGNAQPQQSKTRSKSSATPLISIAPTPPKPAASQNNFVSSHRTVNNVIPPISANNFIMKPANNHVALMTNSIVNAQNAPVPDFQADFTNANIYNSAQYNNNNNNNNTSNNFMTQPFTSTIAFSAFGAPEPPANDRYAALADLDVALRQQKTQNNAAPVENTNTFSTNPFRLPQTYTNPYNDAFTQSEWDSASAARRSHAITNPFL